MNNRLLSYSIVLVLWLCGVVAGWSQEFFYTALPNQQLLPTCNTIATMRDKEGYMWYGTRHGGLCRDDGYRIDVFDELRGLNVYRLKESSGGDVWVGTARGVYVVHKSDYSLEHFDLKNIGEDTVEDILCDQQGNMWVAMKRGEVVVYDKTGNLVQKIKTDHRLSCLFEDSQSQLWAGCMDNALLRYAAKEKRFVERPWSGSSYPRSITEDPTDHCFWISSWGDGVVRYAPKTGEFTRQEETRGGDENGRFVFGTVVDRRHGRLWVSTMENLDLYEIRDGGLCKRSFDIGHGTKQMIIDASYMDSDGNLWIPGHSPHTFILLNNDERVRRNTLTGICKAQGFAPMVDRYVRDGNYAWIWQSRMGWSHYNLLTDEVQYVEDVPERVQSGGEHPVDSLTDKNGHLWVMTDQRIVEMPGDKQRGADEATELFRNQRVYLCSDPQFQMGCFLSLQMDGDSIVVGGLDAVCTIGSTTALDRSPERAQVSKLTAQGSQLNAQNSPRVASITIDGETRLLGNASTALDIQADTKSVVLNLTSCNVLHASHITLAYRIKGLTDVWTVMPMGKSTIELIGLKKGTYTIALRCTDQYGCWSAEVDALRLHRLPAWWESGWAYTLYIIIAIALAVLATKYVRLVKRRQQEFQNMLTLMRMYESKQAETTQEVELQTTDDEESGEEDVRTLTADQQQLLSKAIQCVRTNLSNTEYGIEPFASDMCMGRMTLYRNLHVITGQTPMDFIRTIRLEEAARLITTSSITLAEVSDRCGFSSPSYFSKCFKKKYGVLPKHYGN